MTRQITREEVWAATIEDRPGALAEKLQALADGGINLEMVISRRHHHQMGEAVGQGQGATKGQGAQKGEGVVYVTPIQGGQQAAVAKQAGFQPAEGMHSLKVVATDRLGLGAELTGKIGKAGINLRGLSAAAMGERVVIHLAFDTESDVDKAAQLLRE